MIKQNSVVTMHYELKDSDGEVLDSSKGQDPLVYLQGAGNIIVGLEEQLLGKAVGDNVDAVISPEKGIFGITKTFRLNEDPIIIYIGIS